MRDLDTLIPAYDAPVPVAECDTADSAGMMLGMVVIAHVIAAGAALAALIAGSGWLIALLIHMAIGAVALLGAAVIVSQADQLRRTLRPAAALFRAGRRLTRAI
jgi:zinc transporter ZupT